MAWYDVFQGSDGEWGWEDLAAGLGAIPTGGASIWANNQPGGFGGVWDDLSGQSAADEQSSAIGQAAAQDQQYQFPDVTGPLGSQAVTTDASGNVSLNQTLSPEQQALVDALRGEFGGGRQNIEDALYARSTSRLDPQWQDREEQQRTRLYNMGLTEGDAAYERQMRNLGMARTDAYDMARNQATAAGGMEESRLIDAIMRASNPGLQSYWGTPNATNAAVAQGNIQSQVPSILDTILGIVPVLGGK